MQVYMKNLKLEYIYGEIAGPPFEATKLRTEFNRRKLICFLSRSIKGASEIIQQKFDIIDKEITDYLQKIPHLGILFTGKLVSTVFAFMEFIREITLKNQVINTCFFLL